MNMFENFNLSPNIVTAIENMGFEKPTEIQAQSIPHVIKGEDLIGESATGSGKTLAFGLGIVEKAVPGRGLQALILTPTRELAEQVKEFIKKISGELSVASVYGGVSIEPQIKRMSKTEVVVATPGRLLDHLERKTVDLSKVSILVLDEADRMLDMGFIEDVERIMKACPSKRQTLFFSATISSEIAGLSRKYMNNPFKVSVRKHVDPSKLKQVYYDVPRGMKLSLLIHLLKKQKKGLGIVFCNTRRSTEFVIKNIRAYKVKSVVIHGGMTQNKRNKTLQMFNDGEVDALVCTDVAARGLHIENVSYVYNYEIPADPKDYVHRIGRTARAGDYGMAVNFIADSDHDNFSRVVEEYRNFKIKKTHKPYLDRISPVASSRTPRRSGPVRKHGQGLRGRSGPRSGYGSGPRGRRSQGRRR